MPPRTPAALTHRRERTRGLTSTPALLAAITWIGLSCAGSFPVATLATIAALIAGAISRRLWLDRRDRLLRAALEAGDHEQGLRIADEMGAIERRSLAFQHHRALCLWHTGRRDEAFAAMEAAHRGTARRPAAMLDHARMLLEHRDRPGAIERAEKLLRRLVSDLPGDPEVAVCCSRVALIRDDLDAAASVLDVHAESWPHHPGLLAQRAAVADASGDQDRARILLDSALAAAPDHPHALILRARLDGTALEPALAADSLLAAELTAHHYREPRPTASEPRHLQDPDELVVQRDLGGLQYEVSTWEQLGVLSRVIGWSLLGMVGSVPLMVAATQLSGTLAEVMMSAGLFLGGISTLATGLGMVAMMVLMLTGYRRFRVQVTVDQVGMRIQSQRGSRHIAWSSCEELRRRGRLVEVFREGAWLALPSPNSVVDAQWLEALVADQLAAREDEADAIPEDAAAALRALRQRT